MQLQRAFAKHIRDPQHAPIPAGIEPRRMKVYTELFFNNISNLLAGTFPVLHAILGPERWDRLIRDFMVCHEAHTPLFPEVSQELLRFIGERRTGNADDPPFMHELAHYEWVELALQIDPTVIALDGIERDGDLVAGVPVISPLAWPLAYTWPVHTLAPDHQPTTPPPAPTFLVAWRRLDDQVKFMEINPVTARLIELASPAEAASSGRALLERIAAQLAHPDPAAVLRGGAEMLTTLRANEIVLGTRARAAAK